jgi:hypothetical protein
MVDALESDFCRNGREQSGPLCSLLSQRSTLRVEDPDSELSSDEENIPIAVQKRRKVLSGETYHKQLVDENGKLLYVANCGIPSSSRNPGSTMDSNDERPTYHLPLHPTTMSSLEKVVMRAQLGEEVYQDWLNQPSIQFPLRPDSPIRNDYNNSSSS